jgi:hypothetical protein
MQGVRGKIFQKPSSVKFSEEGKVHVEDPNHLSVKDQDKERPKTLKGRILSFSRSSGRDPPVKEHIFPSHQIWESSVGVNPVVLQTSHIQRFPCGVCKGGKFPKVLGTREDLERLIMGTHVHRSRVVDNSNYLEKLECDCGSVQAAQSFEAHNES